MALKNFCSHEQHFKTLLLYKPSGSHDPYRIIRLRVLRLGTIRWEAVWNNVKLWGARTKTGG